MSRRVSLKQALATPLGKGRYVRRLFPRIADRYDLITVALSYGLDRGWKRRLVEMATIGPDSRVLDLATGTGDLAFLAAARSRTVVGLDITWRMLQLAAAKRAPASGPSDRAHRPTSFPAPAFVRGDMLALPFAAARFDVVTVGYGIRNVPDLDRALDEIARVLRPGGVLLSLDFDRPAHPAIRWVYLAYLTVVGSVLGLTLHGDPDTYRYIAESLRAYPGSRAVVGKLGARGFADVEAVPLLGGLLTTIRARKEWPGGDRSDQLVG